MKDYDTSYTLEMFRYVVIYFRTRVKLNTKFML